MWSSCGARFVAPSPRQRFRRLLLASMTRAARRRAPRFLRDIGAEVLGLRATPPRWRQIYALRRENDRPARAQPRTHSTPASFPRVECSTRSGVTEEDQQDPTAPIKKIAVPGGTRRPHASTWDTIRSKPRSWSGPAPARSVRTSERATPRRPRSEKSPALPPYGTPFRLAPADRAGS